MITQLDKKISKIAFARLIVFVAWMICFISAIVETHLLLGILAFIFFGAFLYLVKTQQQLEEQLQREVIRQKIEDTISLRQKDGWQCHKKENEDQAYYISDLDVVGEDSLFHYLSFDIYSEALKYRLTHPLKTKEDIQKMQTVFKELTNHNFSKEFMITASLNPLHKLSKVEIPQLNQMILLMAMVHSIITLFLLVFQSKWVLFWLILGALFTNLLTLRWSCYFTYYDQQIKELLSMEKQIELIQLQSFTSEVLLEKQQQLANYQPIKREASLISQLIQLRRNPILLSLLNTICLYDIYLYCYLIKHPMNIDVLEKTRNILEDMGAICQMAQWSDIKKNTIYPSVAGTLRAENLKHPLMESEKAVGASFEFNHDPIIITGSNMSGKTTFMRSLGLNLVMFYCGLSVDATCFEAPVLNIYTSMRVADRMQEGVSTFYGELMRIKEMVQSERHAIYLIDEIFKGTNLKDRIIGAKAVIEKLASPHSYVIISTHDEQLCEHEKVNLRLVHFQESYIDHQIHFDYQLKEGMCETSNAQFLMKMTGILE